MKVAVVYNRDSESVINVFGMPNREKIGLRTIQRLANALRDGGHQVVTLEGDKDLVDRLEEFMPRVLKGERPGMVFNVSYGIQGQARYTHVPSILEMVGIPYVGSGPLAHSLALDKVVTKMLLRQNGLPTPDFAVLEMPESALPADLKYPMVVKPKNEAVSFGLKIVHDEAELREGAKAIFDRFGQAVLAEQYIEGREVNVGILGNNPPEAFPAVELSFGEGGPPIYTYEDKTGRSGRTIEPICPAPIGEKLTLQAQELAKRAFTALGCADCARVDMRMDKDENLYILELNSLPSLGEHGSYLVGAAHVGLDFEKFVNRLIEVASARYFGTPQPEALETKSSEVTSSVFSYITQRRDRIERRLGEWTELSSRTDDPLGIQQGARRLSELFTDLGMKPVKELTDEPEAWTWETAKGLSGGTLFIGNLDVPLDGQLPRQPFRREAEWLWGEGIGSSRAPLVMLEYALRALRSLRRLRQAPIGVLYYTDEGRDALHSHDIIAEAASRASRVFVLRPGVGGDAAVTNRRGHRRYRLIVEGPSQRVGRVPRKLEVLRWAWQRLDECARLSSQKDRISVSTLDLRTEAHPMHVPHRVTATVLLTYPVARDANAVEKQLRETLGKGGPRWELELISDRPPMPDRPVNQRLWKALAAEAEKWEIPFAKESSAWPSVAGLVPPKTACLCGVGPEARDLQTPNEAVRRISLMQRTLLLAQFLANEMKAPERRSAKARVAAG